MKNLPTRETLLKDYLISALFAEANAMIDINRFYDKATRVTRKKRRQHLVAKYYQKHTEAQGRHKYALSNVGYLVKELRTEMFKRRGAVDEEYFNGLKARFGGWAGV